MHPLPIGVVIAYVTIMMLDLDREKPALTRVEPSAIPSRAWWKHRAMRSAMA